MRSRKGFTLVEVIVSIVLVSIILVSMLTTLVKLKELYSEVHEDSDALVYSSSIARIINNDVISNNGIRYASCNSQGDVCDIILGNDSKRKLEIVTKTDSKTEPDGRGTLKSLNSVSTLRYIDTTDSSNESMVYVRTLEANIYTTYDASGNMKYTTSDGFNFNRMTLDQYEQDTVDGKKDVVTSLKINIYDGIDETDQNFSAMIYGSGRYDDSGYQGKTFRIELDDNGSDTYRGTASIDVVFGVGFFNSDTTHQLEDAITSISIPKKDGWMFAGYYHYTGAVNPVAIVDSEGNIIVSNTHFMDSQIISNGSGQVKALWEQCKGGYIYNRDTGECKQKTYTISFDKGGGTDGDNQVTTKYRVLVPSVNIPSRAGYIFNGYFTSPNGAGKKYIDAQGKGTGIWLEAEWGASSKLYASWTARNDTPYKVVHWKQNIDAADAQNSTNYTASETENKVGTTDTKVTPPVKSYVGFTSPSTQQININGDGSAVVNYYYKRNKYTITVNGGTGINGVSGAGTYHYGKSVSINATMKAGYSWNRWTNGSGGQVTTTKNYSFNVSGDATYTANATANTNTAYTVKHYKQNLALNGYDLANTDNLTGTTDTSVTPSRKAYEGFTSPAAKTITVKGDGSGLVEYYYTRNSYYLDVNGELDGTSSGNISGYGTFDTTVNGTKVGDDKTDHYAQYPYGSSYKVDDIKPQVGKSNIGNSSYTGTIGANNVTVVLKLKTTTFECAAGQYLPKNSTTCTACPAGNFCPGGTYTINTTTDQGKTACPSGYTSAANATANTSCYINVAAGKYKTSATGSAVAACAAGKYKAAHTSYYNSADSCASCPSGYTSAEGATAQTSCFVNVAAGKYKTSATGSTTDNCAAGKYNVAHTSYYNSADSCASCPSGYTSAAGAGAQTSCYVAIAAGKYKTSATGTGTASCAAGSFKVAHNSYYNSSDSCDSCPSGYTSAAGAGAQTSCYVAIAAGKYKTSATGTGTATCAAGSYKAAHNSYYNSSDSCTTCPTEYTSAAGATAQTSCYVAIAAGKYKTSATGAGSANCAAGSYKAAHNSYYNSSDSCASCPSGYTSAAAATAQTSCYVAVAAGKYKTSATGSAVATCAAGTFKAAHNSYYNSSDSCSACPSGYTSAAGVGANTSCYVSVGAGKYKTSATGTATANCAAGTYIAAHTSYYNRADGCTACPSGYTSNAAATAATSCYVSVAAGKYKTSATGSATANCGAGTYKAAHTSYYNSGDSCTACPSGYTSGAGAGAATSCYISVAAGRYKTSATGSATAGCASGKYKAAHTSYYNSSDSCDSCAANYYSTSTTSANCVACNRWELINSATPISGQQWRFYRDCRLISGTYNGYTVTNGTGWVFTGAGGNLFPDSVAESDKTWYYVENYIMATGWRRITTGAGTYWYFFCNTDPDGNGSVNGHMYADKCYNIPYGGGTRQFCFDKNGHCKSGPGCP